MREVREQPDVCSRIDNSAPVHVESLLILAFCLLVRLTSISELES